MIDVNASLYYIFRDEDTPELNALIGEYLWNMKYQSHNSFVDGLIKYWFLDYIVFLPAALFAYSMTWFLLAYVIILTLVSSSVLASVLSVIKQNNKKYLEG